MKTWLSLVTTLCVVGLAASVDAKPVKGRPGIFTTGSEAIAWTGARQDLCDGETEGCWPAAWIIEAPDKSYWWWAVLALQEDSMCTEATATYSVDCSDADAIRIYRPAQRLCPVGYSCTVAYAFELPPRPK